MGYSYLFGLRCLRTDRLSGTASEKCRRDSAVFRLGVAVPLVVLDGSDGKSERVFAPPG